MEPRILSEDALLEILDINQTWDAALRHVVVNLWAAHAAAIAVTSSRSAEEVARAMAQHFVSTLSPTMGDANRRSISAKISVLGSDVAGLLTGEGLRQRAPKSFSRKKK